MLNHMQVTPGIDSKFIQMKIIDDIKNLPPADPTANIPMRQMRNIMPGVADQFLIERWNSYENTTLSNQ